MLLLAGCASVPDLGPKPAPLAAGSIAAARSLPGTPGAAWPGDRWWTAYGDPQLDALIDEGLRNSPDLAAALARVRRAQGLAQQAGAAWLPTLDVEGQASLDKQSQNNGIPPEFVPNGWQDRGQLAAAANFDLDLWGRNRAALAAAVSEARAAAVDAAQARLVLSASIAATYADFAAALAEQNVRQRAFEVREASRKLVAQRRANGLETLGSVRQAEAAAADAHALVGQAVAELALRRDQLAALVGAGPDRGLDIAPPTLIAPGRPLPADVTTDLVGRRPDIVAARERVEAAARRIDVARADFYPAINLSALIGVQSLGLGNLFQAGSVYGHVAPAFSLPVFHGGALRGAYRARRGEFDEAVANYDRAVLEAYRQAADAVTNVLAAAGRLGDARAAAAAAEDAYRVAQDRYRAGLATYLDVLAVEDRLLDARLRLAQAEAAVRASDVALVRALGGGFTGSTVTAAAEERPHG